MTILSEVLVIGGKKWAQISTEKKRSQSLPTQPSPSLNGMSPFNQDLNPFLR